MRVRFAYMRAGVGKHALVGFHHHGRDLRVAGRFGGHFQHQRVIIFIQGLSPGEQPRNLVRLRFSVHLGNTIIDDAADHFRNNGVFIGEVAVDLPDAQLRLAGDLRHAGSVKTMTAKAVTCGSDDFILPDLLPGGQGVAHGFLRGDIK